MASERKTKISWTLSVMPTTSQQPNAAAALRNQKPSKLDERYSYQAKKIFDRAFAGSFIVDTTQEYPRFGMSLTESFLVDELSSC